MTRPKRGKGASGSKGDTSLPSGAEGPRAGDERARQTSSSETRARAARPKAARAAGESSAERPLGSSKREAAAKKPAVANGEEASKRATGRSDRAHQGALANGKSTPPMVNGSPEKHAAELILSAPVAQGAQQQGEGATVAPPARRARAAKGAEVSDAGLDTDESEDLLFGDGLVAGGNEVPGDPRAFERHEASSEDAEPASRLARGSSGDRLREAAAFGSAQSLLSTDYYFRQYGARGMRSLLADVDDFGFDPHVDEKVRPILEAVCKRYFRVEVIGSEHIPANGRALLVANRSGALPWDGLVLRTALRAERPELAPLRWLSEDSVIHYPFMGVLMNRLGAVRACPENAERLLAQNRLVAVFPEGAQGSRKLFRDRYRLQRFGRGGYVKLALKFDAPILPTAIIGGEETNPVLGQSRVLARFFGRESFPITPTFPWLGPAGLLPAPVRWKIVVGEPIDLSAHGSAAADDALIVHRLNEQIRSSLQALVDHAKRTRGSALFR